MNHLLMPHPSHPSRAITSVGCNVHRRPGGLILRYTIEGDLGRLVLPPLAKPYRTDGLWRSTCLELFAAEAGNGYAEYNFSPSGAWAAYAFSGRREGMAPLALDMPPDIHAHHEGAYLLVTVLLDGIDPGPLRLGITAVIEEKDGTKSYWALHHGGDAPDFHDPDCFVAQLPPAD
ncbi:DOMON-like domain-containing protein [Sphingomonas elodea]|uniref:DOMON-like domain-containing protein n=1 Tax=Sphingomonas elodea TaxID=179878 RepID=UPI00058BA0C6|nr:DOMON-like domain-containing protein [Sphingomonas elodea]